MPMSRRWRAVQQAEQTFFGTVAGWRKSYRVTQPPPVCRDIRGREISPPFAATAFRTVTVICPDSLEEAKSIHPARCAWLETPLVRIFLGLKVLRKSGETGNKECRSPASKSPGSHAARMAGAVSKDEITQITASTWARVPECPGKPRRRPRSLACSHAEVVISVSCRLITFWSSTRRAK